MSTSLLSLETFIVASFIFSLYWKTPLVAIFYGIETGRYRNGIILYLLLLLVMRMKPLPHRGDIQGGYDGVCTAFTPHGVGRFCWFWRPKAKSGNFRILDIIYIHDVVVGVYQGGDCNQTMPGERHSGDPDLKVPAYCIPLVRRALNWLLPDN